MALLAVTLLGGCFDYRHKIMATTLLTKHGTLHAEAFAGALSARFPAGTSLSEFHRYLVKVEGTCRPIKDHTQKCEIPIRGMICAVSLAAVTTTLNDGDTQIQSFEVEVGGLSC